MFLCHTQVRLHFPSLGKSIVNHHGRCQSIPHGIFGLLLTPKVCSGQLSRVKIVNSILIKKEIISGKEALAKRCAYVQ